METVVDHCGPETNNDTAKDAHTVGKDTHNRVIGRVLLCCLQQGIPLSHQIINADCICCNSFQA